MAIYEFRCRECGNARESQSREILPCRCGGVLRRVFHCNFPSSFKPHFNHSVGQYVDSEQHFRDILKHTSERESARQGVDVNLVPVDPADKKGLGVTDEGMEATMKRHRDTGLWQETGVSKPTTTKIFSS